MSTEFAWAIFSLHEDYIPTFVLCFSQSLLFQGGVTPKMICYRSHPRRHASHIPTPNNEPPSWGPSRSTDPQLTVACLSSYLLHLGLVLSVCFRPICASIDYVGVCLLLLLDHFHQGSRGRVDHREMTSLRMSEAVRLPML